MTRQARTCSPSDSLNTVAELIWENDCGCIPVVDADGMAIAMVADRDICMAAQRRCGRSERASGERRVSLRRHGAREREPRCRGGFDAKTPVHAAE